MLNLLTLSAELGQISESYIAFGSVAGVSPASLTEIVNSDSMTEVCDLWLKNCQQEQTPPTWHAVAEILDLIGQKKVSNKLLQVYNTGLSVLNPSY